MSETNDFNDEIYEGKNKSNIRCQFCNSLILKSNTGNYAQQEYNLPLMHQKNTKSVDEIEKEVLNNFWSVDDMFAFENVGFSNTVQNVKFLICADCEMGPVGYHDITTKKSYIALKRIKHDSAYVQAFLLVYNSPNISKEYYITNFQSKDDEKHNLISGKLRTPVKYFK